MSKNSKVPGSKAGKTDGAPTEEATSVAVEEQFDQTAFEN